MRAFIFFFLVFSFVQFSFAQEKTYGGYTKEQLYADFDSLMSIIEQANPHLPIYKKLMNTDVIDNMKKKKTGIENINSLSDYWYLLNLTLGLLPEAHTRWLTLNDLGGENYDFWSKLYPDLFDSTHMIKIQHFEQTTYNDREKENRNWDEEMYRHFNYSFMLEYVDGKYYNSKKLVYIKQHIENPDSIILPKSAVLQKVNDMEVDDFVNEHIAIQDYPYAKYLRWDNKKKKYYTTYLAAASSLMKNNLPVVMEFFAPQENRIVKINIVDTNYKWKDFFAQECPIPNFSDAEQSKLPKINLFDSILYIRVPIMNLDDLPVYEKEIGSLSKKKGNK